MRGLDTRTLWLCPLLIGMRKRGDKIYTSTTLKVLVGGGEKPDSGVSLVLGFLFETSV